MHISRDLFVLHFFFFPADVFAHSSMLVLMCYLLQVVGVVDLWQPCFREIQEVLPSLCLQQDYASQVDLKTVQLTDHILCELLTQRYEILFLFSCSRMYILNVIHAYFMCMLQFSWHNIRKKDNLVILGLWVNFQYCDCINMKIMKGFHKHKTNVGTRANQNLKDVVWMEVYIYQWCFLLIFLFYSPQSYISLHNPFI